MPLLVRTWNVFHGNAVPPERRAFLEEMVRLAAGGDPDVVCLQEVPLWALSRLESWSGMQASGGVAARPRLVGARIGGAVTGLHHGVLRSAFTGQANATLVARRHRLADVRAVRISRRGEGERRVCHVVRVEGLGVVGNFHATAGAANEQALRAAAVTEAFALPDDGVVLAGDTNLPPPAPAYDELAAWGFSKPVAGIDQILVRGVAATEPIVWPAERRRAGGRLLSDHAPVELRVG